MVSGVGGDLYDPEQALFGIASDNVHGSIGIVNGESLKDNSFVTILWACWLDEVLAFRRRVIVLQVQFRVGCCIQPIDRWGSNMIGRFRGRCHGRE